MNKRPVTILIISTLIFLIGVEFYFLISTYQQTKNIKKQLKNIERSLEELKTNIDKKQSEEGPATTNTLSNKKNGSGYSSKKLASPDGNKKFYYTSKDPEVEGKKIESKNEYSNYFFAFNGDTKYYITDKEDKYNDSDRLFTLTPKIKYSDGEVKDLTNYLQKFPKSLGAAKVLRWYNTSTLLLASSYGDAGSTWMNMDTLNINNGNEKEIISCYSNVLTTEGKAVSYCATDKKVVVQNCKVIQTETSTLPNSSRSELDCRKISSYKVKDSIDQRELRNSSKLSTWSEEIKKAELIDKIKIDTFLSFYDETSQFNIDNAGQKFKIKSIHQDKDSIIWDLSSGKLKKTVN